MFLDQNEDNPDISPVHIQMMQALKINNNPELAEKLFIESIEHLDEGQKMSLFGGESIGLGVGKGSSYGTLAKSVEAIAFMEVNATNDGSKEMSFTRRGDHIQIRIKRIVGNSANGLVAPFNLNLTPNWDVSNDQGDGVKVPSIAGVTPEIDLKVRAQAYIGGEISNYTSEVETFKIDTKDIHKFFDALKKDDPETIIKLMSDGIHTTIQHGYESSLDAAGAVELRAYPDTDKIPASQRDSLGFKHSHNLYKHKSVSQDEAPYAAAETLQSGCDKSSKNELQAKGVLSFGFPETDIVSSGMYTREQTEAYTYTLDEQKAVKQAIRTRISPADENHPYDQEVYSFSTTCVEKYLEALEESKKEKIEDPQTDLEKLSNILHDSDAPTDDIHTPEFRKTKSPLHFAAYLLAQEKEGKQSTTRPNSQTGETQKISLLKLFKERAAKGYKDMDITVHSHQGHARVMQVEFKKATEYKSNFSAPIPMFIYLHSQGVRFVDTIAAVPEGTKTEPRDSRIPRLEQSYFVPEFDRARDFSTTRFGAAV